LSQVNPLFIDSTRMVGAKVVTKVELFKALPRDNERLMIEVMNQAGFIRKYPLEPLAAGSSVVYVAELWLNYQHQIQFRFLIESDGIELFTSAIQNLRAGHIVAESWEPVPNGAGFKVPSDEASVRRTEFIKEISQARPHQFDTSRPLCKPSFVAEIKSLLEDLF
jgi:hypothetical protein